MEDDVELDELELDEEELDEEELDEEELDELELDEEELDDELLDELDDVVDGITTGELKVKVFVKAWGWVKSNVVLAMTRNTHGVVRSQTKPGSLPRMLSAAVGTL